MLRFVQAVWIRKIIHLRDFQKTLQKAEQPKGHIA